MNGAQRVEIRCIEVTDDEDSGIDAQRSSAVLEDVDIWRNDFRGRTANLGIVFYWPFAACQAARQKYVRKVAVLLEIVDGAAQLPI